MPPQRGRRPTIRHTVVPLGIPLLFPLIVTLCLCGVFCLVPLAMYLTWLGAIFGVLGIIMALLQDNRAEMVVKLVVAAIWFTVAGIAFFSRRTLENVPDAGPAAGSGA